MNGVEKPYLAWAFAASTALHGGVYRLGHSAPRAVHPAVELDLTMSGHVGMLGGGGRRVAAQKPATPPPAPKAKDKDWVKSATNKPAPIATPSASPAPASPSEEDKPAPSADTGAADSGGFGEGDGDPSSLTRLPVLLNLGDLATILRKFFPEAERDAGREGVVVVDLHVDENGRVTSAEVARSADPAFDEAAKKVARLLRFSPAYRGAMKVPVKLRQAIKFNLEK